MFPPGLDFVKAFFGCMYAGAVAVPAFTPRRNRNVKRLQAISDDAEAAVAMTVADVRDRTVGAFDDTPQPARAGVVGSRRDRRRVLRKRGGARASGPIDLALLQYTSGSTGTPKGVMLTHGNIMYNVMAIVYSFEPTQTGLGITWLPTYHDMGLIGGVLKPMYFRPPERADVADGILAEASTLAARHDSVLAPRSVAVRISLTICASRRSPKKRWKGWI